VTGGAGFIGSHLVERLIADGDDVVVIDNIAVGQLKNLASMHGHPRLSVHVADVTDTALIAPLFTDASCVFHLAALADIVPSIERPRDYYRANVDGTFNVCEAARAAGVKRLVYAASSSCYGIPDCYPTSETAPIRPQYPYALTKYLGEQIVLHWGQVYGVPSVALRFFNVYGPRARTSGTYGAVFGVFLAQKLAGKPYTIVGDGEQTRDFTYVSDIVAGLVAAAESNVRGEAINLGSGGTHSVNTLVRLLGGPTVHIPKRPGEPDCTFADTAKAQALLGWRARVSLEDGVAAMLEHIDDWRDAPLWNPATIAHATHEWFARLAPPKVA
jgi:UDP-glucose 4-epimerase